MHRTRTGYRFPTCNGKLLNKLVTAASVPVRFFKSLIHFRLNQRVPWAVSEPEVPSIIDWSISPPCVASLTEPGAPLPSAALRLEFVEPGAAVSGLDIVPTVAVLPA